MVQNQNPYSSRNEIVATVVCPTSMSSLRSPQIRGAPQSGLAMLTSRTSASAPKAGRPPHGYDPPSLIQAEACTAPTNHGFRSDIAKAQHTGSQAIEPSKYDAVDAAQGRSLR
jgi:hypothetical protein